MPNGVLCMVQGDVLVWELESPRHYPVYVKDSLLNTDFAFDYGAFLALETEMLSFIATYTPFTSPYYFAHSFLASAGTYMFGDAQSPLASNLIVRVMPETASCDNAEASVVPRSPESLAAPGVTFRPNLFVYTDLWLLFVVAVLLCLALFMVLCGLKSFQRISWLLPDPATPFYRRTQKRVDFTRALALRSRSRSRQILPPPQPYLVAKPGQGTAEEFEDEMEIDTERQLKSPSDKRAACGLQQQQEQEEGVEE